MFFIPARFSCLRLARYAAYPERLHKIALLIFSFSLTFFNIHAIMWKIRIRKDTHL